MAKQVLDTTANTAQAIESRPLAVVKYNWRLYLYEAIELAFFMVSACAFTILLFDPSWPGVRLIPSEVVRRIVMGIAMGVTALVIIHSPMGKQSGAHFNPAITLTYFRLGKIGWCDTLFYIASQFVGAIGGVAFAAVVFGSSLSKPAVNYVVTVPGRYGTVAAFFAEMFMAAVLMAVVLLLSNRVHLAAYVSYALAVLIAIYVFIFAPISGFSINPARTTGSALFAGVWTAGWLYFVAPLLGMFLVAELYLRVSSGVVLCAKLHPDPAFPCPFHCHFPGHRRSHSSRAQDPRPASEIPLRSEGKRLSRGSGSEIAS